MAYGVDQCRRCGKPIRVNNPDAMRQYEASRQARRPTMTPKQWKAKGWKAAPTFWQMWHDLDGVCYDCKPKVVFRRRILRLDVKAFWLFALISTFFTVLVFFALHTM